MQWLPHSPAAPAAVTLAAAVLLVLGRRGRRVAPNRPAKQSPVATARREFRTAWLVEPATAAEPGVAVRREQGPGLHFDRGR